MADSKLNKYVSAEQLDYPASFKKHLIKYKAFDKKIGGTIHLALGRSYPETGGQNI
ncbi:MAG: hypothetical protein ACLFSO_02710 [Halanaerobium sp.]